MSRLPRLAACALVLMLLALGAAAGALAAGGGTGALAASGGTNTSAGDNQYVDPLTNTTHTTTTHATAPAATTPAAPTATQTAPAATTATTPATTSTTASSDAPSHSLPYTGLNLPMLLVAGIGLLGSGLLIRRIAARPRH